MLFVWCERFAPLVINNQRHRHQRPTPEPVKTDLFEKRSRFPVSRPSSVERLQIEEQVD